MVLGWHPSYSELPFILCFNDDGWPTETASHQPVLPICSFSLLKCVITINLALYYQGGSSNLPFLSHRNSFHLSSSLPFFSPDLLHHLLSDPKTASNLLLLLKTSLSSHHPILSKSKECFTCSSLEGDQSLAGHVSDCHSFLVQFCFILQTLLEHLFFWLGFETKVYTSSYSREETRVLTVGRNWWRGICDRGGVNREREKEMLKGKLNPFLPLLIMY